MVDERSADGGPTTAGTNEKTTGGTPSGLRQGAIAALRYGAMLFGALVIVQIYLAGSGIFAATGPVKLASSLDPHRVLGNVLAVVALLVLIAAIVARPGRRSLITAIVMFVLTGIEGLVAGWGSTSPYLGALHPVIAVVILGLAVALPLWTPKRLPSV
ncbi:MAG TPA: DUF6220 domain-containing protein [Pseudonocardiaceae bacterium]|nr:DUF6220 domain-containing protein [Pseudonocardiaceae bacterium]